MRMTTADSLQEAQLQGVHLRYADMRGVRRSWRPPSGVSAGQGVELARGLEPLTARLQVGCATNCATPAGALRILARHAHGITRAVAPSWPGPPARCRAHAARTWCRRVPRG